MISSLVIKLDPRAGASASVLEDLGRDDRITVGPLQGGHLPVVIESPSLRDGRNLVEEIERWTGVLQVDLVEAHFETGDLGDGDGIFVSEAQSA